MSLKDQIFEGGGFTDSAARLTNTTGVPVVSAVSNGDGRLIADEYALTFASVVAGTSANVSVLSQSPNNPYRTTKAIVLDGVTEHKDVIPGLTLVFSNNNGFTNAWAATVKAGEYLGTFDAFGAGAGTPSTGVRHRITNDGTGAVSAAKARLLPIAKWVKKTGSVFNIVRNFAEGATEKTAGGGSSRIVPYVIVATATSGAGNAKIATITVDGVAVAAGAIRDLSTGADGNGAGLKCVTGYFYRFTTGALTGLEFSLSPSLAQGI